MVLTKSAVFSLLLAPCAGDVAAPVVVLYIVVTVPGSILRKPPLEPVVLPGNTGGVTHMSVVVNTVSGGQLPSGRFCSVLNL